MAAQYVAHSALNVKELNCDFLVFSGHKMVGLSGIGILYSKKEHLETFKPTSFGGGMVEKIRSDGVKYKEIPYCFEAGRLQLKILLA